MEGELAGNNGREHPEFWLYCLGSHFEMRRIHNEKSICVPIHEEP